MEERFPVRRGEFVTIAVDAIGQFFSGIQDACEHRIASAGGKYPDGLSSVVFPTAFLPVNSVTRPKRGISSFRSRESLGLTTR